MNIGLPAVAAISGFTLAVAAGLLLLSWFQHRSFSALGIWGIAFATGAVATGLIVGRGRLPDFVSIVIANALLVTAYGLMWSGARKFDGRAPLIVASLSGAGIWLAGMLMPAIASNPTARASLIVLINATYTLLTARELWRARGEGLHSRWPAVGLLVLHALSLPTRIPLASSWEAAPTHHTYLLVFVLFESILLSMGAAYLFSALVRERLASGYRHAALIDSLTGIDNRRSFLEQGARMLQRAARERQMLCLLLFDLDHFKNVNDHYGHATGDGVLMSFCRIAAAQLRPTDLFGRLGGEEFACLLVDVTPAEALTVAERVRFAFEGAAHTSGDRSFGATVSVGMALARAEVTDLPSMLISADRALYRAKKDGRNRVAREEPVVEVELAHTRRA
jgi:diguanylate cyclase (GGDEF)-like protein